MKRSLILTIILGTLAVFPVAGSTGETSGSTAGSAVEYPESQPRGRWNNRRYNRNRRTYSVIRTRIVWRWGRRYRETYRITYYRNGTTRTQLLRRVRIW